MRTGWTMVRRSPERPSLASPSSVKRLVGEPVTGLLAGLADKQVRHASSRRLPLGKEQASQGNPSQVFFYRRVMVEVEWHV